MNDSQPLTLSLLRELDDITVTDRVRQVTALRAQERLDAALIDRIAALATAPPAALTARISELEQEWDLERALQANAAVVGGSGILLAAVSDKRWLLLTAVVSGFLLQHALHGWCPPLALLRRMGIRTRREIDLELHALKALRGDYQHLRPDSPNGATAR